MKVPFVLAVSAAMSIPVVVDPASPDDRELDTATVAAESRTLRPELLELALVAYRQAEEKGRVRRAVLAIIDYSLPSYEKRLWVIDMTTGELLFEEWVAHGMGKPRGSGGDMEEAHSFSNETGTLKSSLGLFVTAETYSGRHGYSLKLDGLEEGVNDNARERLIVIHGADYVSADRAEDHQIGRSWGCPVVRTAIARELIDTIKGGAVVWIYYPVDEWLEGSVFLDEE